MADLGRAALLVTLGLSAYALVAGAAAAALGRRRLAHSARNALFASFVSTLVASVRARRRVRPRRLLARVRRGSLEPRPAAPVQALRLLGRAGGVAAALAARPDRVRERSRSGSRGGGPPTSSSG